MTARAIGDVLGKVAGRGRPHITGQPVRANSYRVGDREHRVWRPIADGTTRRARRRIGAVLRAARRFEQESMERSRRNGALGHIGLEVLEALYSFADYKTGRCDPSVDTIAAKIKRSYKAVRQALERLRAAGFVEWIRRCVSTGNEGQAGPQVQQTSNAYGFLVPPRVEVMVRQLLGNAPPPEDAIWQRNEHAAQTEAMLASLPLGEQGSARISDPGLAAAVDALGAALDRRSGA
ncbi:helix-turn-helix domain-containing protein [Sphingomonas canadensis]|uniref:Helix-turn-helix domain-containing protein n=1 Tax=Sphingomonas canadensis TaxID=1219257 RepID=A0ABW3H9C0_9SPHN|nr:helix-turn-helix domain-containing protein [Sphingomonas canadensis]MCW3837787.1 helix-turn-helix domain-containing protein [Sphingomonas canadensis]